MARHNRLSVEIRLTTDEYKALKAFNKGVSYNALFYKSITQSRKAAVMGFKGKSIQHLAAAFRHIHPQWFTNGRGDLANGTPQDCKQVVYDVIEKLDPNASRFQFMTHLFDLSGNGAMPTGRRPLANTGYEDTKVNRTRIRTRRVNCKYHPEKEVATMGLCSNCYQRGRQLRAKGVHLDEMPEAAVSEILLTTNLHRHRPLYAIAIGIRDKYNNASEGMNA